MVGLESFLRDDAGTVTVDWVAITASVLLLGVTAIYALYNTGVADVVNGVNGTITDIGSGIDLGATDNVVAQNAGSSG